MAVRPIDETMIQERFSATQPRRAGPALLQFLLTAAITAVLATVMLGRRFGLPESFAGAAPAILVGALVLLAWRSGRRRRSCRSRLQRAWAHLQLGRPAEAAEELEAAMRRPLPPPERSEAFMLLADLAERQGQYHSAARIYERLLDDPATEDPQRQEAQIALAAAKLRNEELTDALQILDRLARTEMGPAMKAAFELVRLFQQVFMGQFDDALAAFEERRRQFRRHLSTRAAYGYALLAAALDQAGRAPEAGRLWQDATTLLAPDELLREYRFLGPVGARYPATERPL
jgi:tetratricopeptide (TPR) repeat protein